MATKTIVLTLEHEEQDHRYLDALLASFKADALKGGYRVVEAEAPTIGAALTVPSFATVAEAKAEAGSHSGDALRAARALEEANKDRAGVLKAIDAALAD